MAQGAAKPTHIELAAVADVNERTISKTVRKLAPEKIVLGGRPMRFGPGVGLVLGLAVESERLRGGLVDANGDLHHEISLPPVPGQLREGPKGLIGRLRRLAADVLAAGLSDEALWGTKSQLMLLGVSVSWASPVDRDSQPGGRALRNPGWHRVSNSRKPDLSQRIAAGLGGPFHVDHCHSLNDANAHAMAIVFDQSRRRHAEADEKDWRMALVVLLDRGLGAATVMVAPHSRGRLSFIDSRLIVGTNGFAGELGHSPVPKPLISARNKANNFKRDLKRLDYDEAPCSCGKPRHLEAFASATALANRLRSSGYEGSDDKITRDAVTDPDGIQSHALTDVGRILGGALANPILMINPHDVTLVGSLATEQVRNGVMAERDAWSNALDDSVKVNLAAEVGDYASEYAGVRGAALAVIRRSVFRGYLDTPTWREEPFPFTKADLGRMRRRKGTG